MQITRKGKAATHPSFLPPQFWKAMKLTAVFLTLFLAQASARLSAQQVSYSAKGVTLETAFNAITEQTKMQFFFDPQELAGTKPVTVDFKNLALEKALEVILKDQPLEYKIKGKTIFINAKKAPLTQGLNPGLPLPAAPTIDVHGVVKDESGKPAAGVSVAVKGTNKGTTTNDRGEFSLIGVDANATLVFSSINLETLEFKIAGKTDVAVNLRVKITQLEDVAVEISTGYQKLPKERATGSFGYVDGDLLNRKVGATVLDKLDGLTPGLQFVGTPQKANVFGTNPAIRNTGLTVRGVSTLSTQVGTDPLIVLDNFPYNGDLANLNPNDIESVTILKDGAAASIWGARAGNGVIVLTTKKGRLNTPTRVEFNSSVSIANKPDIFKDYKYLNTSDFIDVEDTLFLRGFFNSDISNTSTRPALTPVIDILSRQRAGLLSAADAAAQINALRGNDVRNDFYKYTMQKAISQQYFIGLRGGGNNVIYNFSVGYDNNRDTYIRNGNNRITINSGMTYIPIRNLEITTSINYTHTQLLTNNIGSYPGPGTSGSYGVLYPYAKLVDGSGNTIPVSYGRSKAYGDSLKNLGFLDYSYNPIDETNNNDNTTTTNDYNARIGARYKILPWLNVEAQYQRESQNIKQRNYRGLQTYYARDLINQFTIYNASTGKLTYQIPKGGILNLNNIDWSSYNWRGQVNIQKTFDRNNVISAVAGAEIRELNNTSFTRLSYGYDEQYGTSSNNLDYFDALPVNPGGTARIPYPDGGYNGVTQRYVAYYTNAAYTFMDRYTLSASARKDGANIFGVKTNDRVTPLWSIGGAWRISKERFYKIDALPELKVRATYGFNGNVYNGSAYVTGLYGTNSSTGAQQITGITAPNPELRWEKVRNINVGIDFALKRNILQGTIDLYQKEGMDLIEPISLPASVGFTSFNGNAAETKTNGIELTLNAKLLNGEFKWNAIVIANFLKDQTIRYDAPLISGTIISNGLIIPVKGKSLYSVYAYKWAGLDSQTGDPQGYVGKAVSKDYTTILANYQPDSLQYFGSARPTRWGSIRNEFYYKGFSLSVMIMYKGGYYFRRPSSSPNYPDAINSKINKDYVNRWQKPGDDEFTNVPSFVYPANNNRSNFYQYSAALVEKGDLIRLQDIRIAYDVNRLIKKSPFKGLQVYSYASNLGILWRANKKGYDPDNNNFYSAPFQIAFGLQTNF